MKLLFMMEGGLQLNIKQALVIAVVFGLVAACVVWYLERFEINKFHGEVQDYMKNQNAFQEWLSLRDKGSTE